MPLEATPPELPPWDPAAAPVEGDLLEDPAALQWVLVRYVGQPMGEAIPLPAQGLELGRAPESGLCLQEPQVSRRHARLEVSPDLASVSLWDLSSTNGVFVNGRRLPVTVAAFKLVAEDVVRVGGHAFKLKHMDALERRYHRDILARTTLDPLTGVHNRATILQQLESHVELARRHHRPLSLFLADLDRLKQVNDTFGHRAGDQALEAFGGLIRRRLRSSDPVGRLGGDEFLAVLPETSVELALSAAEDFRRSLAERALTLEDGRAIQISCSIGVAELKLEDICGGSLLARADVALYGAKDRGRNCAVAAP